MLLGHMTRLAVWQSRAAWSAHDPIAVRLHKARAALNEVYPLDRIATLVAQVLSVPSELPLLAHVMVQEEQEPYEISF